MRRFVTLLALLPLALSLSLRAAPATTEPTLRQQPLQLLLPGQFHGDEVQVEGGSGWFALVEDEHSTALVPVTLKITTVFDAVVDKDEHAPPSGKEVRAEPSLTTLLYLKGALLHAGTITTASHVGKQKGLTPKGYTLGTNHYSLTVAPACNAASKSCDWILYNGQQQQTLHQFWVSLTDERALDTDSDNTGVLWAGDLDRDGKLDLIVDISNHYNSVADVQVFLSSLAKEGQLVGSAGRFSAMGC